MSKIALIYGSSRPSKVGENVAKWFEEKVELPDGVELDPINLADVDLPILAEPQSPMMGDYQLDTTKEWAKTIEQYEGFIFVVAEYNLGYASILKNAIDTLYAEWKGKAAGLISYGSFPKSSAVEQLRVVLSPFELKVADETLHVTPFYKAIAEDGSINESMIEGSGAQEVLDAVVANLG